MALTHSFDSTDGFLIDKISDGIVVADPDGTVRFVNPAAAALLGRDPSELVGQSIGLPIIGADFAEVNLVRRDGKPSFAELRVVETEWKGRPACVLSVRDVTARHEAAEEIARNQLLLAEKERQLLQSQKLEAVGRLAGGIAHDFNNMLSTVIGYATLIRSGSPDAQLQADKILQTSERGARLVRQLLAFGRNQVLQPRVWSVNKIVREGIELFRRLLPEDIEVKLDLSEEAGNVKVDRVQIEQALVNLLLNARDAMPEGGTIRIETGRGDGFACGDTVPAGSVPGAHAFLRVADTGHGMNDEVKARAFEPFFTTKEPGAGTGLGLSTVYGIVTQSGGSVGLSSEEGSGTCVEILLPLTEEKETVPSASLPHDTKGKRKGRTVLIAEDEEALRELLCEVLKRSDYKVLEAINGKCAYEFFQTHQDEIDALVTDLVMPIMGGIELGEKVRRARPTLPIVFMSGYSNRSVEPGPLTAFIEKPFHPVALLNALREVLEEHVMGVKPGSTDAATVAI